MGKTESEEEKAYWQYKKTDHLLIKFEKFQNGLEKLLERKVFLEEYFSYDFEKEVEIAYKMFILERKLNL